MKNFKYTEQERRTFAETVLTQMGGISKVCAMIGVKQIMPSENTIGQLQVIVKFKAKSANKSNTIRITIEGNDLYKMEFLSIRGVNMKDKGTFTGLYAEMLKPTFEKETQLYLSL